MKNNTFFKVSAIIAISPFFLTAGFSASDAPTQVSYIDSQGIPLEQANSDEGVTSLQETMARAYMQNADLDAARAGLRSTDETVSQANADWRPSLSVQGNQTLARTAGGQAGVNPKNRKNSRSTGYTASISQNVYNGGKTEASIGKAESDVLSGRSNLVSTEQETLFKAISDHTDILKNAAILSYQQKREKFYLGLFQRAEVRYEVGEGSRTDVEDARGQYEGAKADVSNAMGNLETSKATYLNDVGSPPGNLAPAKVTTPLPKTYEEALDIAQSRNPSILAARYTLEAALYNVDIQRSGLLPTVDVQGTVGNRIVGPGKVSSHTGAKTTNLGFETTLSIPIYAQGIPNSQIRQAFQIVSQQKVNLVKAQRAVVQQTDSAWSQLAAKRESVKGFLAQVKAQELAVEGALEEYEAGTKTMLDVQQIEQNLIDAEIQLATSQQELILAAYGVLSAMGRLTAREMKLDVKYYDPDAYYNEYKNAWIQFWQGKDLRYVKDGEVIE